MKWYLVVVSDIKYPSTDLNCKVSVELMVSLMDFSGYYMCVSMTYRLHR